MNPLRPLALVALSLLSSCFVGRATVNDPLDAAALAKLQPGVTTAQQAVTMLGAPTDVVQLGKRFAYRYDHTVQKQAGTWLLVIALLNTDSRQDRAWLFFDENGTLSHVGSTLTAHHPQYSFPWENVHEPSDREADDAKRFGTAR